MGIFNGIIKKYNNRINNKVSEDLKKDPEKYKKYRACSPDTKEKIRKKRAEKFIRKDLKKAKYILALTGATVVLGVGISHSKDNKKDVNESVLIETETMYQKNQLETDIENSIKKIDKIQSKQDTTNFFKEVYLDEYNKENNTNIQPEDIKFYSKNQDMIYEINLGDNERISLTHGSWPEGVELKLEKDNINYEIKENSKIYGVKEKQEDGSYKYIENITISDDGEVLNVIFGDDYIDGKLLEKQDGVVLNNMGKLIASTVDLTCAYDIRSVNFESEITLRKNDLKEKTKEYYINKDEREKQKNKKQIQEDIEEGVR